MHLSTSPLSLLIATLIGAIIGFFGGPAIVLIPWALVGLIIGGLCTSYKSAILNGTCYGFALAYVFMLAAYNGAAPVSTKVIPFILFGIVGAVCGVVLTLIGYRATAVIVRRRRTK